MIITTIIEKCHFCGGINIVRNGRDYKRDQKFYCHDCQGYGILNPETKYSEAEKEIIKNTYQERASMRGIKRIFGVVQRTLRRWLEQASERLGQLKETLAPFQSGDVLELDELWSFVFERESK